jgi:acyl-CoA thioester hydrolase
VRPFNASVQLRWTDLDVYGHVNNVMVADYLQQARAQFLLAGPAHGLLESGLVVVSHQIVYRRAIQYSDDPLRIELGISELGAARFVVAYRLLQDGQLCVEARTVLCPFDFTTQLPRRLSGVERDYLAAHQVEVAAPSELAAPELAGRGSALDVHTRWSDPDRYGHINNVRFLDYVLAGRLDMTIRAHPSMARVGMGVAGAINWLVARQDIDYLAQMDFRLTPYRVLTAPVQIGQSSVVLATEIIDPQDDTVLARARVVLVSADEQLAKQPLPDPARAALERLLISG